MTTREQLTGFFSPLYNDLCMVHVVSGFNFATLIDGNVSSSFLHSAENNFSSFTGRKPFQIFLLVGQLTNWTRHNLLTDKTLKKITQDVLVRCVRS